MASNLFKNRDSGNPTNKFSLLNKTVMHNHINCRILDKDKGLLLPLVAYYLPTTNLPASSLFLKLSSTPNNLR